MSTNGLFLNSPEQGFGVYYFSGGKSENASSSHVKWQRSESWDRPSWKVFFSGLDTNSFSVAEVISNTRGWWLDCDSARSLFSTPPPQTPGSFVYHRLFEDVCVQVWVDRLQSCDTEWAKKRDKWRDIERNHQILWLSIININTWYADKLIKLIGNNCLLKKCDCVCVYVPIYMFQNTYIPEKLKAKKMLL